MTNEIINSGTAATTNALPEGKEVKTLSKPFVVKDHLKGRLELETRPGWYEGEIMKAGVRVDAQGGEHLWVLVETTNGRGIFPSWNLATQGGKNALAFTLMKMGIEVFQNPEVLIGEEIQGTLEEGNVKRDGTRFLNFRAVWDK